MSNVEIDPSVQVCDPSPHRHEPADVLVLQPREVPLGGPRAMTVRRTLPHRDRSFVGAWCFVDHYGPDEIATSGGMDVPPHPHTGLQTVSWLFTGEIEHRDTAGNHAIVRPGELNLMTAGHGIAHTEVSTSDTSTLHGVQLWVVLPQRDTHCARAFEHFVPEPVTAGSATVRVFLGSFAGADSPVATSTPLLGAEVLLPANSTWQVPVEDSFEHAVLVDEGVVRFCGRIAGRGALAIREPGATSLTIEAGPEDVRVLVLGGAPFPDEVIMWWNFIGRSTEEIRGQRAEWMAGSDRFGTVAGYEPASPGGASWLPAPDLPEITLRPRRR